MRCSKARLLVSLSLDGEISPRDDESLAAHLSGCRSCRREYELLGNLMSDLVSPPELAPSPRLLAGVLKRIAGPEPRPRPWPAPFSPWAWMPAVRITGLALVLLASLLFGYRLGREAQENRRPAREVTAPLNLDFFADLPQESFGGTYQRLLAGQD